MIKRTLKAIKHFFRKERSFLDWSDCLIRAESKMYPARLWMRLGSTLYYTDPAPADDLSWLDEPPTLFIGPLAECNCILCRAREKVRTAGNRLPWKIKNRFPRIW